MTDRLAVTFAIALLAASPVRAQTEVSRELELGVGWFQDDPLDYWDVQTTASGPSVNVAWTTWRNERTGFAVGVTSILGRNASGDGEIQEGSIYPHATWRWRWVNVEGRGFFHVGVGAGPVLRRGSVPTIKWDPELQTTYNTGETEDWLDVSLLWHVELMVTRALRDGLDLRVGVQAAPLLHVPLTAHPVVMAAWRF